MFSTSRSGQRATRPRPRSRRLRPGFFRASEHQPFLPEEAAAYDVEDLASAHVRFTDGSWMTLEVAWGWDAPEPSYSFEMMGECAGIRHDPLRVVREVGDEPVDVTPAGVADTDWDTSVRHEIEAVVRSLRRRHGADRPPGGSADQSKRSSTLLPLG